MIGGVVLRALRGPGALAVGTLAVLSACSLGVGPDAQPGSARVRAEGSAAQALMLVVSTDFIELYDPETGGSQAALGKADTTRVSLPYDRTIDLGRAGRLYVELRNTLEEAAHVRLWVELDNGKGYDHADTLAVGEALVYSYVFGALGW